MQFATVLLALSSLLIANVKAEGAVDASAVQSVSAWQCAFKAGFTRAIPRVYSESCSSGGAVSTGFSTNVANAKAAGYTSIDVYMFPCTGSSYPCKSASQQVSEAVAAVSGMTIGTFWIDLEKSSVCTKNWDGTASANIALAKSFISAAQSAGQNVGVYSSSGNWQTLFGSKSAVVASGPVWYAHTGSVKDLSDWPSQQFGGYATPAGHQYSFSSSCGGFDLSNFGSSSYSSGKATKLQGRYVFECPEGSVKKEVFGQFVCA